MTFHAFGFSDIQQAELGWGSCQPALQLRPWIEHYYLVRPQGSYTFFRLYPDGGSTLTIPLDNPRPETCQFGHSIDGGQRLWQPSHACLGIRFAPGGFYALFGMAIAEINKQATGWLTDLPGLAQLCELVAESHPGDITKLNRFFLQRLSRRSAVVGAVQLWQEAGLRAPQELLSMLRQKGVGRRTLERKFQVQVGVSPGQLYTWQRLKLARNMLRNWPAQRSTDIALSLGYYDQPHFVRQFRQHCGQTPNQYRQRKLSQFYNQE